MTKHDMKIGSYYRRPSWHTSLCILVKRFSNGILDYEYYKNGESLDSYAMDTINNTDFIQCDKFGNYCVFSKQDRCSQYGIANNCIGCTSHTNNIFNLTNNGEKEMKKADVNYIGGEYKLVEVTFDLSLDTDNDKVLMPSNPYTYKADIDMDIKKGDMVVVESSTGYGLVKVIDVFKDDITNTAKAKKAKAWVASTLKLDRHLVKKEQTERREYIHNKLKEKAEQVETLKMYEMLAKIDPEAKKLMLELEDMNK